MSFWTGRSALVTGGSAGLGRHVAGALVAEGARVALVARNEARLADCVEWLRGMGGDVTPIVADVSQPHETRRAVEVAERTLGGLDLAVACAGASMRGSVVETPRAEFERLLAVNFLAAVDLAQGAGPLLEARRGSLVLVGSLATFVGPAHLGAYPASKHPLAALAQQLRMERGPAGLHTLLVCPGPIARDDAGERYNDQSAGLPDSARRPGGGAKVRAIDPGWLARRILRACQERRAELVTPRSARLLFALSRLSPTLGDWLLRKKMG